MTKLQTNIPHEFRLNNSQQNISNIEKDSYCYDCYGLDMG
jgi:hypothetical protein